MAMLDFKEIPPADTGNGDQDSFELFAREFFAEVLHFEIVSEPNRGADGGKDLIAVEHQIGSLSSTDIRWLISCKHKAHSGHSVKPTDEESIIDRLKQHNANGFIGFYSTIPSTGLNERLDSFRSSEYKIEVFNHERIESELIKAKRNDIIQRFFPISYNNALIKTQKNEPSIILGKYEPLLCEYCGEDLLQEHLHDYNATIVFIKNTTTNEYVDIFACCKGHCDDVLMRTRRPRGCVDEWKDISDWIIPLQYLKQEMAIFNQLYTGVKFSEDAFEKLKQIVICLSQFALRMEDDEQKQRSIDLSMLPEWI